MQIDRQMTNISINEGLAGVYAMWPQTRNGNGPWSDNFGVRTRDSGLRPDTQLANSDSATGHNLGPAT